MIKIGADHHLDITGKQAIKVGGSHSLHVTGAVTEQFDQAHSEQVSMGYYLKALNVVIEASVGVTLKCGGNYVTVDPVGVTIKGSLVVIDGSMTLINSGPGSPALSGSAGSLVAPTAPVAGARRRQGRPRRDGAVEVGADPAAEGQVRIGEADAASIRRARPQTRPARSRKRRRRSTGSRSSWRTKRASRSGRALPDDSAGWHNGGVGHAGRERIRARR